MNSKIPSNAPVTVEIRRESNINRISNLITYYADLDEAHELHELIKELRATFVAEQERKVRLMEANLWNSPISGNETRDHEYHIGFDARCRACRERRIAELEPAGTERSEKA